MGSYDAIVIGAGNGGLTAAATLAKEGAKVLMLERHNIPGGCGTSFCRGRFEFEVALHQLSGIGTDKMPGPLRSLLESLGVFEKLEFIEMKDLYRVVLPGELDVTLRPDRKLIIEELSKKFPEEKEGIEGFIGLVFDYFNEVIKAFIFKDPEVTREKYPLYFKYALMDTQKILDKYLKGPKLKLALSVYWTYAGMSPEKLAFHEIAAMLFVYIFFKPYHLKGGSQAMSSAIADVILDNGGEIRYNTGVRKIIIEDGAAKGVVTDKGEDVRASFVVSNASKISTYTELVDKEFVPDKLVDEMKQASIGPSAITIYMGLDCSAEELGITESTNFLVTSVDMEKGYDDMSRFETDDASMLLTCYNIMDESFSPPGTCQIALVTLKYGEPWLNVPPTEYTAEKYRCAGKMLEQAEKSFPGLRDHIEEMEIATPITHLRYLNHPKGAIYGFDEHTKDSSNFISSAPTIEGLYNVGAWIGMGGFQPTLASGVSAARSILKKIGKRGE